MTNWIKYLSEELEINEPCYRYSEVNKYKKDSGHFDFKFRIWRKVNVPFLLYAIPVTYWEDDADEDKIIDAEERRFGVTTKKARYRNTGNKFYQSFDGPESVFAYEYVFEAIE